MPDKNKEPKSAFSLALSARKGDIKPEQLFGAAKQLYNDKSLSKGDLARYAENKKKKPPGHKGRQQHRTLKRT